MKKITKLSIGLIIGLIIGMSLTGCTSTEGVTPDEQKEEIEQPVENVEEGKKQEEKTPAVVTVEDGDFKKAMTTILTDNAYASYFAGIDEREIEFDGSIDMMTLRDGYDTRYELLITYGDYSETKITGPYMKVKDIAYGPKLASDIVEAKTNVKVRAKIDKYDLEKGYLMLDVISIERR